MRDINDVTMKATNIGNTFIQILIGFAVIWIIFNVVRFLIVGADSEDKRKQARDAILYGVVGLFVILSIWGLVNVIRNTFWFNDNRAPTENFPEIPLYGGAGSGGASSAGAKSPVGAKYVPPNTGIKYDGSYRYSFPPVHFDSTRP